MDMTIGLRLDPVRHEGVWDGTRPRPRPWPAGQGPVGADDRASDEETGRKKKMSPFTAGVLFFAKSPNAFPIFSKEAFGFGSVAIEPGYKVGINNGNCSFTAILTTSNTTSTPGARVRSLPATADTNTRNSRLKSQKGIPVNTQKLWSLV